MSSFSYTLCPYKLPFWGKLSLSVFAIGTLVHTGYSLYFKRERSTSTPNSNQPPEVVIPLLVAAKQINDQLNKENKTLTESDAKVEF
jgi:hypothetical protein